MRNRNMHGLYKNAEKDKKTAYFRRHCRTKHHQDEHQCYENCIPPYQQEVLDFYFESSPFPHEATNKSNFTKQSAIAEYVCGMAEKLEIISSESQ